MGYNILSLHLWEFLTILTLNTLILRTTFFFWICLVFYGNMFGDWWNLDIKHIQKNMIYNIFITIVIYYLHGDSTMV